MYRYYLLELQTKVPKITRSFTIKFNNYEGLLRTFKTLLRHYAKLRVIFTKVGLKPYYVSFQVGGVQPHLPGPAAGLHLPEDDHLHLAPAGPGGRLGGHVSSEASL